MSLYFTFKALHIIFIVSWFAGLFYLVRLFIYTREAQDKPEPEKNILTNQLLLMQKKLLNIITIPAMILSLVFGILMILFSPAFLTQSWMIVKLIFVLFLLFYQWYAYKIYLLQKQLHFKHSSIFLRIYNEVATILLIAIVFLAVFKTSTNFTRYFSIIFFFIAFIAIFIYVYNKKQKRNNE
ncbi:MAG: protoporphyrinogen oxidase HemJ [Bacteroidia bacterium]